MLTDCVWQQMSDPYGSDTGDMPARHFVLFVLKASRMMLTAAADLVPPTEATEASVRELRKVKRVDGAAWSAWSAAMR